MKVKLDEIIEALEFVNDGIDSYAFFDPETKEIYYIGVYTNILGNKTEEEIIKTCIMLPTKFNINEYSMLEEFIETIEDPRIYNQLQIAINGKGAFRRFKDTCKNFNIEKNWYSFRDEKYKNIAIEWCNDNNIDFE